VLFLVWWLALVVASVNDFIDIWGGKPELGSALFPADEDIMSFVFLSSFSALNSGV
jgi:hypothetical protein